MKDKVIAVVILILILGAIVANAIYLDRSIANILENVEELALDKENSLEQAEGIYQGFKDRETYISITVNHEDLTSIEEAFSELIGHLRVGDIDGASVKKHRLIDSLEHLRRSCGVNIDAII